MTDETGTTKRVAGKPCKLTQERLKQLFHYDPETGVFTRKLTVSSRALSGGCSFYKNEHGYRQIRADYRLYRAHHLAWLYMTGAWPDAQIDHIDGNRENNRFANLRPATNAQNGKNRGAQSNNKLGLKGVSFHKKSRKYRVSIVSDGSYHYLGLFDCPAAAHFSYIIAADKLHGEFARAA